MWKENGIYKLVVITMIVILAASCSGKVPINTNKAVPTKQPTEVSTKPLLTNNQEAWGNYISNIARNREVRLLYEHKDSEINLDEYLKQGKIKIKGDQTEIEELKSLNVESFLIDLDKDGIDELCMIQSEGSIRHYYVKVFKKDNGMYVYKSTTDGYIYPIKYNNEVHFISTENDFETKYTNAIIEYELDGLSFKQKEILNIRYTYDVSGLPESITKIIDYKYLDSLSNYKISDSNIAKINDSSGAQSYVIVLTDEKNNNTFRFTLHLWLTSVGYAPNEWEFESKDKRTLNFKGIDKIITHTHEGTEETVCYGVKFHKDESNNIFLLKVSYPFYTTNVRKDGDLILQLFKFNKNSVDEVENKLIEPNVEVEFKKAANT